MGLQPPKNWTFKNHTVAEEFDNHVREQLPWYDLTTEAVVHIARHYIPENGVVYDFGASTGNIGNALRDILSTRNAKFIPIDNSEEMRAQYRGPGVLHISDIIGFIPEEFDVAICFLTLMFLPPAGQIKFLSDLRKQARPGGCIIIVDKEKAVRGYAATVLWRLALAFKRKAGVTAEEIIAKELSLSGVQRPISKDILGPDAVRFFKMGEFSGWFIEA